MTNASRSPLLSDPDCDTSSSGLTVTGSSSLFSGVDAPGSPHRTSRSHFFITAGPTRPDLLCTSNPFFVFLKFGPWVLFFLTTSRRSPDMSDHPSMYRDLKIDMDFLHQVTL